MASIIISGTLLDPSSKLAIGDEVRFTHKTTTGSTIQSAQSSLVIGVSGAYSIELQYGLILVEYKDHVSPNFKNLGVVTVNQDSTATSLPELLNAIVPPTDAQLLEFQAILADCVTEADRSETEADRSETAASVSEAFANQLTTTELIANTAIYAADVNIGASGFLSSGDGGAGHWVQNGQTAQPVSQTPAQLGDALLNDGNGNQWAYIPIGGAAKREISTAALGVFPGTDKSAEIQACLNAAENLGSGSQTGGLVVFGNGEFLAKELTWPSRVKILGAGRNSTTLKLLDSANSYLLASKTFVNNQTNVNIRHQSEMITFDGNKANQTSGDGLIIIKSYRSMFVDTGVINAYSSGIRLTARMANGTATTADQAENNFTLCYFNQNGGPGIFGDDDGLDVIADGVIENCVFNSNSLNEKLADVQIDRAAGWKILNNQIYGGGFHCISLKKLARSVVTGNHCDLDAVLAVGGDTPACIHIESFGGQSANTITNNPIFLDHDGISSGATPRGVLIESSTSEALDITSNPMRSNGTNDQAYEYTPVTKLINATINNPIDAGLSIGDKPSDICENWSNNEIGTFTPVATFQTVGDFAPTYSIQDGAYKRIGDIVYFKIGITMDTNAYTTSSGVFRVTGLPYTSESLGSFFEQAITVGPFSNISIGTSRTLDSFVTSDRLEFRRSDNNTTHSDVGTSNILPSTSGIVLNLSGFYFV